jgi:3D (Asp-Asp-Asp) domain-containing protein
MIETLLVATALFGGVFINDVKTTGYCAGPPCVDAKWADGKTASGTDAKRGVCASDWGVIPKGTVVLIPGYGTCRVEDTGNPNFVNGIHLDLFFETEAEAWAWGVRNKMVKIISIPAGFKPMIFGE